MLSSRAIRITELSKAYKIRSTAQSATTLAELISSSFYNPWRPSKIETFWAIRELSVEVERGQSVGVVGHNGAGKSTLLKLISRITEPTLGRIELFGRVGALLEVGTGFHGELTGKENIYLNGAILGMRRSEISRQFDAIVDFSGVGKFLETPVKRYSSGMYVRLAFAVAAHLNPEILIVDEVLAVGDVEFQKKCLGKMQEVSQAGRTVLFVSHNIGQINRLCGSAILLERGRVKKIGSASSVTQEYLAGGQVIDNERFFDADPNKEASITRVKCFSLSGGFCAVGKSLIVEAAFSVCSYLSDIRLGFILYSMDGTHVFSVVETDPSEGAPRPRNAGDYLVRAELPTSMLNVGVYKLFVNLSRPPNVLFDRVEAMNLSFQSIDGKGTGQEGGERKGLLLLDANWECN